MQQRKLLLPPFHGERLRSYGELIARAGASARSRAGRSARRSASHERMERLTLEVILDVVFGITDEARKDELRRLLPPLVESSRHARLLGRASSHRDFGPIRLQATFAARRDAVDALLLAEIAERRAIAPDALAERTDILSMLVEADARGRHADGRRGAPRRADDARARRPRDDRDRADVGDGPAARNPDVLARLRAAGADGDDEYLDAVCRRSLRIRPVVPVVGRIVTEPVAIGDARGTRPAPDWPSRS